MYNDNLLVKKFCTTWLINLMMVKNNIEYESNFFEYVQFLTENLKEVVSNIITNIKEYNNSHKRGIVPADQITNLQTSSKALLPDALESMVEDYPHTLSVVKSTITNMVANNLKLKVNLFGRNSRLYQLKKLFSLDNASLELIYFIFLTNAYEPLEDLFRSQLSVFKYENYALLSQILKIDETKCKQIRENLESMGITNTSHMGPTLTKEIDKILKGINSKRLQDILCSQSAPCQIPLADFTVNENDVNYVLKLLGKKHNEPTSILLYGKVGSGKSSFARALATTLKVKAFQVSCKEDDDTGDRKASLVACLNLAKKFTGSFTILDEAESVLHVLNDDFSFGTSSKAWLTNLMETRGNKIIWIANNVSHVPPSIKRRFAYSIYFPDLTSSQQIKLWQKTANRLNVENKMPLDAIRSIVDSYSVPVSMMENSIRLSKVVAGKKNFLECVKLNLEAYSRLLNNGLAIKNFHTGLDEAVLEGIALSDSVNEFLDKMRLLDVALKANNKARPGLGTIIMHGPSGSGKSFLAKYLAKILDRPCLIKRASDLLSKYIGESEKLIAQVFNEAEYKSAVLVIDEVDALIGSRQNAYHSWEQTQIAEFLTSLEEFGGIFIGTTNFYSALDPAVVRRFAYKLKFDYAQAHHLDALYKSILAPLTDQEMSEYEHRQLLTHKNLVVGDFNTVRNQFWLENKNNITHQILLFALAKEAKGKLESGTKRLGFAV